MRLAVVAIVLLAACAGCTDLLLPETAVRIPAPAYAVSQWAMVETCSGLRGDVGRVQWWQFPEPAFIGSDGQSHEGAWHSRHNIYVGAVSNTAHLYRVVRHEMLHDLTQSPDHGPLFDRCGLIW